jgi:hypothetical protein
MPQFYNHDLLRTVREFGVTDQLTLGFILSSAFVASDGTDNGENDVEYTQNCTMKRAEVVKAARFCKRFKLQALQNDIPEDYIEENCGHDLALTCGGHGAGFWDGDHKEHGDKLTAIARRVGGQDMFSEVIKRGKKIWLTIEYPYSP